MCVAFTFAYPSTKIMKQNSSFSVFVFLQFHSLRIDCTWSREGPRLPDWMKGQGWRRAGRAAGQYSWTGQLEQQQPSSMSALLLQEFYEGGREEQDSWGGTAGEYCSPGPWRRVSWAAKDAGWRSRWREREWKRWWEEAERRCTPAAASLVPQFHFISSLLLFNFILHFVKILTSPLISFSIFSPPHIRRQTYIISPSTPQQQYLCPHNVFLLSLEKQRKRHDGAPNKMFVRRKTITKISTWEKR